MDKAQGSGSKWPAAFKLRDSVFSFFKNLELFRSSAATRGSEPTREAASDSDLFAATRESTRKDSTNPAVSANDKGLRKKVEGCRKHHSLEHDFFISYRVDRSPSDKVQSELATALHVGLETTASRFFDGRMKVYLDRMCIKEGALWEEEFLTGLRGSHAVILLLSKKSWDIMIDNLENGKPDNVLKEIEFAVQLKKLMIPLCVKAENESDFFFIHKQNLLNLSGSKFDGLKQASQALESCQMIPVDPKTPHMAFYQILSALYPAQLSDQSLAGVPQPFFRYYTDVAVMKQMMGGLALSGHCIVSGIAGIGKSTLAQMFIQYATARKRLDVDADEDLFSNTVMYERIFWINCATLDNAVGALRDAFGTRNYAKTLEAFRSRLSKPGRLLYVFDSVDNFEVVNTLFESLDGNATLCGDFVVTTRMERVPGGAFSRAVMNRSLAASYQVVKADLWTFEVVKAYLLERCPALLTAGLSSSTVFDEFLKKLGGYPIVIEQLVSYCDLKSVDLDDIELNLQTILAEPENIQQKSLVELVMLSMKELEKTLEGRMAIMLFACIGWLDGSQLQSQLVKACVLEIVKCIGGESDKVDVLLVFKRLSSVGILRQVSVDGIYSVHSLHQTIIRDLAKELTSVDTSQAFGCACKAYLNVMGYGERLSLSAQQARMANHSHFLANCKESQVEVWPVLWLQICHLDAMIDNTFAKLNSGRSKLELLVQKAEELLGTREHAFVADALSTLAVSLMELGLYKESMDIFQEALRSKLSVYGTRANASVSNTLNGMGALSHRQGQYEQSFRYFQESYNALLELLGKNADDRVSARLNNMGATARKLGRLEESLQYYKESLQIADELYGRCSELSSHPLEGMGYVALSMGRLKEARRYFEESLEIGQTVYKTRVHFKIGSTLRNLGEVALAQHLFNEALQHMKESLDVKVQVFGTRVHGSVGKTLVGLGKAENALGNYRQANSCCKEALEIYLQVFDTRTHDDVAEVLWVMGEISLNEQNFTQAIEYLEEALAIIDKTGAGDSDPVKIKESLKAAKDTLATAKG
ncbi:hypothetical protein DFJ73DRAFT_828922 [Zopfochytrium polystomum]|nr:hypothetical protein DFJ73DRAFT_828922 [Zopfochytrium polystomum]